jgi:hypothetical protein
MHAEEGDTVFTLGRCFYTHQQHRFWQLLQLVAVERQIAMAKQKAEKIDSARYAHKFSIHSTTQVRDLKDVRLKNTPGGSC